MVRAVGRGMDRAQRGLDREVVVDGPDAAEEVDVEGWRELPDRKVIARVTLAPDIALRAEEAAELDHTVGLELQLMRCLVARDVAVVLVCRHRQSQRVKEVADVRLGAATAMQLLDGESHLGRAVFGRPGREQLDHLLEAVIEASSRVTCWYSSATDG